PRLEHVADAHAHLHLRALEGGDLISGLEVALRLDVEALDELREELRRSRKGPKYEQEGRQKHRVCAESVGQDTGRSNDQSKQEGPTQSDLHGRTNLTPPHKTCNFGSYRSVPPW